MGIRGASGATTGGRAVLYGASRRARPVSLAERRPAAAPEHEARAGSAALPPSDDPAVSAPLSLRAELERIVHRALMSRSLGTPADFVVSDAVDQLMAAVDADPAPARTTADRLP